MKAAFTSAFLILAPLVFPLSVRAQAPVPAASESEPVLSMAAAGAFAGIAGVVLGGTAGFALVTATGCSLGSCLGLGVVLGAAVGLSAGTPYGVHLANHRRGSYRWALLASVGVTSLALALASGTDSPPPLYSIPIGQIVTSILIERATM